VDVRRWREYDRSRSQNAPPRSSNRLGHHCHLVTIRGNSYRMRQHTELSQTLHAPQESEPAARRRRRQEAATS